MKKISLPIDSHLPEISEALRKFSKLILTSSPGSGKTTRVPSFLAAKFGRTLVLEPRRVAAVAAATRVADEEDWETGREVGYQVRLEKRWQLSTKLVFVTEAILHQFLLRDPELSDFSVVIVDEFHERSWQVDLALSLLLKLIQRRPIKLVVMSATLNIEALQRHLGSSGVVEIEEAPHQLHIHHENRSQSLQTDRNFFERVQQSVHTAVGYTDGNVLVFLPGVPEIRRMHTVLGEDRKLQRFEIRQLHGSLSLDEQREILQRTTGRIVLATNVAESSLTLPNVDVVIDTGLEKTSVREKDSPFSELRLQRISQFSARQRAGRAAREKEGHCFRLWSAAEEKAFAQELKPRALVSVPAEMVLMALALGYPNLRDLPWLDEPSVGEWDQWLRGFRRLDVIDEHYKLTAKGRKILQLPLDFEIGQMMVAFTDKGRAALGAVLAQFLQDGEPRFLRSGSASNKGDFLERLADVERSWKHFENDPWVRSARLLSSRLDFQVTPADLAVLIASLPDRVGRWRKESFERGILSTGRGVNLDKFEKPSREEFFICLRGIDGLTAAESQISWHIGFGKDVLLKSVGAELREQLSYDFQAETGRIVQRGGRFWRQLPIDVATDRQIALKDLPRTEIGVFQSAWNFLVRENESLADLVARTKWLADAFADGLLGEVDGWKLDLRELLPLWVEEFQAMLWDSGLGIPELKVSDFSSWFESLFSRSLWLELQRQLPSRLHHSHKSFRINYTSGRAPEVEGKIQDFFGLTKHPALLDGTVPLRLILLGPHKRPVQITVSILDFWRGSYSEVRKDLRARYPKHKWPEDPLAEFRDEQ